MEPEAKELRGFVIKNLLKNKEHITATEKIKITKLLISCDNNDLFDSWNYQGRKDPEGPEGTYTFKLERAVIRGGMTSGELINGELVPESTVFHFKATFEPLNP